MKLYTQREVAALFRVTIRTVERMRQRFEKQGRQFGVKVGGSVRFTQEHVDMVLRPPAPESDRKAECQPTPAAPVPAVAMREAALRGREIARQLREKEAVENDPTAQARLRGRQIAREQVRSLNGGKKRARND